MVLLMSVNPGFGGQKFIPRTVERVRELSALCTEQGVSPLIQIDGGIDETTAPLVAEAGARVLVAGSAIFCADDPPRRDERDSSRLPRRPSSHVLLHRTSHRALERPDQRC